MPDLTWVEFCHKTVANLVKRTLLYQDSFKDLHRFLLVSSTVSEGENVKLNHNNDVLQLVQSLRMACVCKPRPP